MPNGLTKGSLLPAATLTLLCSGSRVDAQPAATAKTLHAHRIASPVRVDGVLDDEAWREAEAVSDFVQQDPHVGEAVSESTEVRVLVDHEAIRERQRSLMSPNRVNRREFLTSLAAAVAVPPRPLPPVSWTCPMHPEVVDDQRGACPICRMPLAPVRLDLVWSCQLHLDITQQRPGTCRACGRQLVKIIKALSFTCPSHAKVNEINPGKCPIDKRALVAKYSLRPHGDHNPKHGGQFIMAPNNWHVEATHPAPSQFRLYVYDEYSRPFIPKGFTSRIVMGQTSTPFKPAAVGAFLEARMPQTALPATIVVGARFEDKQPEYRLDFQFHDYSKEPK